MAAFQGHSSEDGQCIQKAPRGDREPYSRRPTTVRTDEYVNHVQAFLRSDCRLSIK